MFAFLFTVLPFALVQSSAILQDINHQLLQPLLKQHHEIENRILHTHEIPNNIHTLQPETKSNHHHHVENHDDFEIHHECIHDQIHHNMGETLSFAPFFVYISVALRTLTPSKRKQRQTTDVQYMLLRRLPVFSVFVCAW